ncbi:hypothetical protein A4I62_23940, partial [Salmonella enterica subsp. enterica serovar Hull]|nr:hypothetical protein [Salmonella enterica subsp. enterica serovar Hull]
TDKKLSTYIRTSHMIQDDDENIKIAFYCKSHLEETRGGGMEQIIYIISKKDFKIEKINKNYSK